MTRQAPPRPPPIGPVLLVLLLASGCLSSGPGGAGAAAAPGGGAASQSRPPYYASLAARCRGSSCCLASVDAMHRANATLSPPGGCPPGTQGDMLRCIDSYQWCAPAPGGALPAQAAPTTQAPASSPTPATPAYYDALAARCKGSSCCLSSVDDMRRTNSTLEPAGGCPPGTQANMLRCIDSYRWCQPGAT